MTSPVLAFLRRLSLADLMLPAGAALISTGLQRLVDREHVQRTRLAAVAELVDVHRDALAAAGVSLPPELDHDESHPLDVDGAIGIVLARHPHEPEPAPAPAPRHTRRRLLKGFGILALAGAAGITVYRASTNSSISYHEGRSTSSSPEPAPPTMPEPHPSSGVRVDVTQLDEPAPEPLPEPAPEPAAMPVRGEPAESCGWPGCEWTSDGLKTLLSQQTAAAVHRNRCVYRPAGAHVSA